MSLRELMVWIGIVAALTVLAAYAVMQANAYSLVPKEGEAVPYVYYHARQGSNWYRMSLSWPQLARQGDENQVTTNSLAMFAAQHQSVDPTDRYWHIRNAANWWMGEPATNNPLPSWPVLTNIAEFDLGIEYRK